jgi:hypothetical protein
MELTVTIKVEKKAEQEKPRSKYRAIAGKILHGIASVRIQPEWPEYPALVECRAIEVAGG